MLEPQNRRHLMEALRPPVGYELDRAIGTTFSLDLLALLTAPLSFTIFGWEEEDGSPSADPLALFEGLRRYSGRISIFCQVGQIAVPTNSPLLLGYLEDSVIEVTPKTPGRIFHPKVWALRFVSDDRPVMYRLLVLSRNLTFDRSWDTVLALEGEVSGRKRGYAVNRPLGEFIAALPGLAVRDVPEHAEEAAKLIQEEIRRTDFELPQGFDDIRFWPLGLSGRRQWPFVERVDRLLCISPFVGKGLLNRLPGRSSRVLVSRHEELDTLDLETVEAFQQAYVLRQEAELEDEIPEGETQEPYEPTTSGRTPTEDDEGETLRGLHAKVYVADAGWNSRIWTGSANATHAAFSGNIEFMVELAGRRSRCGIDRILGASDDSTGFQDLLQRYDPTTEPADRDETRARLEHRCEDVRRNIVDSSPSAAVTASADVTDRYVITLNAEPSVSVPEDVTVRCWPITLRQEQSARVFDLTSPLAEFELSLEALTPFFAFAVTATEGNANYSRRFVLNVPLSGAPENRREAIVEALLSDRGRVMRLIFMLLAEGSPEEGQLSMLLGRSRNGEKPSNGAGGVQSIPLFEEIVRALWNNPRAIDRIESMLATLRKSERGVELIPEDLEQIWPQVMEARSATRREGE